MTAATVAVAALVLVSVFLMGLSVGIIAWKDPGRCNKVIGSQASVTAAGAREVTVTCLVERVAR